MKGSYWMAGGAIAPLLLSSCATEGVTSSSGSPIGSSEESSSEVSSEPIKDIGDFLLLAKDGYKASSLVRVGSPSQSFVSHWVDAACDLSSYSFISYESSRDPIVPEKTGGVRTDYVRYPLNSAVAEARLGLNNKIAYLPLSADGVSGIAWSTDNFANFLSVLEESDFSFSEGVYELKIDGGKDLSGVSAQLGGALSYDLASFTLDLSKELPTFSASFEPVSGLFGDEYCYIRGEFTYLGDDPVEPIEVAEDVVNEEFASAMASLALGNYRLDATLPSLSFTLYAEDKERIAYTQFDLSGAEVGNYGYYELSDGSLQGVTKIGDAYYPDKSAFRGDLGNTLPDFDISPALFTKGESSNVYRLREDINVFASPSVYSIFGSSSTGSLSITIEEDKVIFANDLGYSGVETFAYSNLGQVGGIIGEVKANGDGLTWNELLSYDEDQFEELLRVIPSDVLSAIPVIGGHYNYFSLEASYNPGHPVISYAIDSEDEGADLIADYGAKLASSGFALSSLPGENGGLLYEKSVDLDGAMASLAIELAVGIAGSGYQFLIYPTLS